MNHMNENHLKNRSTSNMNEHDLRSWPSEVLPLRFSLIAEKEEAS